MGVPRILVNLNAYVDGVGFQGEVAEFEEPKLALEMEDYRGGGMLGPVKLDKGLQAMEANITMAGHVASLIRKFGVTAIDGVRVRLVGAYRADDGSAPQAVEIYIGGRFSEIDLGKAKAGDNTEHKYTVPLSYYRRVVDGQTSIEIDMIRGVFSVGGIDRYADIMAILNG